MDFGGRKTDTDPENSSFGGLNLSPTAREVGLIDGGWVKLTGSLDSPNVVGVIRLIIGY